jgi:hypothetical protein
VNFQTLPSLLSLFWLPLAVLLLPVLLHALLHVRRVLPRDLVEEVLRVEGQGHRVEQEA